LNNITRVREALLRSSRKSDTMFPVSRYRKNINTQPPCVGIWCILQNSNGTDAHFS